VAVRHGLALLILLALAGCSAGGDPKQQRPTGPPLVVPRPSPSSTVRPRPVGAGTACGRVTTVTGAPARVVVAKGRTTCAEALRVFHKYFDPATPAEGTAGLAVIDHWTCETRQAITTCTLRATRIQARS
jgi:hypothetical protein